MTQEEKIQVFNELSVRLFYGVKAKITINNKDYPDFGEEEVGTVRGLLCFPDEDDSNKSYFTVITTYDTNRSQGQGIEDVKPYLRPMSSMTDEEEKQFQDVNMYELPYMVVGLDWLNAHHFDYRGLINDGLALEATDGIYENVSDLAIDNTTKITVGCKIRSKTNPDVILSIVSDDCHGDKFECSNGSVLSLKQIKKHYDIYIEENKGTIVIN